MIEITEIKIYANEEHLKSGLNPVKQYSFGEKNSKGHDESILIERAADNAKQNMRKFGLSKGVATFEIRRITIVTVYNEQEFITPKDIKR